MKAALYRFADDVPAWVAIPIRAVVFTIALVVFAIFLAGSAITGAVGWWWEQVKG